MWRKEDPQGYESQKIKWELVPYMRGDCLDLGCGPQKVFPHFIGVDSLKDTALFGIPMIPDVRADVENLRIFASGQIDLVFSSHVLEHIAYERVPQVLSEWFRVLKVGGHLALYLPSDEAYPKVGEPHANPDHKWDVNYEKFCEASDKVNCSWDMVDFQKRYEGNEYSLFFVMKKLED